MCRHIAYLGPEVSLASVLFDPPHSLVVQASAPRHQTNVKSNPDGFGVGWYEPEPQRHRTTKPMWTETEFAESAQSIRSGAFIAAIRAATPGLPIAEACTAPFQRDGWFFSHNGVVPDWRALGRDGDTDSEVLFAVLMEAIDNGSDPRTAIIDTVVVARSVSPQARANLLLTDGKTIIATASGASLFTRHTDSAAIVASEPYDDDPSWRPVDDNSIVVATRDELSIGTL